MCKAATNVSPYTHLCPPSYIHQVVKHGYDMASLTTLTLDKVIQMAIDVTSGLQYLSEQAFVYGVRIVLSLIRDYVFHRW